MRLPGSGKTGRSMRTRGIVRSGMAVAQKLRENLSAGLGCAAITDHDNVTDLAPVVLDLGAQDAFHSMIGNEVSVNGIGHFNAYPLPLDPADPYALVGVKLWVGRTIAELFTELAALETQPVIQVNHPRDGIFKGYLSTLRYDAWAAEAQAQKKKQK